MGIVAGRKPSPSRRREIADAALKVAAEQGPGRLTAWTIAREVGLSDAALFRHFPSKGAIVLAAIDRVGEILFEGFPPEGADPVERLGRFFRQRVRVIRENPGVARLVGSEQLAQVAPPEGVARVAGFRRRSQAFVRDALEEAHRAGLLAPGLRPDEAAVLVLGALLALGHAGLASDASGRLAEGVWGALEAALRGRGIAPRPPPPAAARRRRRR